MKEHWYETKYEDGKESSDCCGPTVLYTSQEGILALADELTRIAAKPALERYEIEIADVDQESYLPFTHVQIAKKPPEDKAPEWSWKPFIWLGVTVLVVCTLALYGLVTIILSFIK